jgi:hypothetical protein
MGHHLTAVLMGAGLTLAGAPAASAATLAADSGARASVQAGRLVLEPTGRGYRGMLPVTVTNVGDTTESFALEILESVAGSFRDAGPDAPCVTFDTLVDGRRTQECAPALRLDPGQRGQTVLSFEVLTTIRPYAMRAGTGTVTATVAGQQEPAGADGFGTVFRSTAGTLHPARPYVQDTEIRASIAGDDATLTRVADGRWFGRVPVTVRWAGDAAHDRLWVDGIGLPAGVRVWATEADSGPASTDTRLYVPGGRFMPGEERRFDLVVVADAETPAGDLGMATFQVGAAFYPLTELTDANPSDNSAAVRLTAVENN